MARVLSANLTSEMNSLNRRVATALTAERWLPKWTAEISGLSAAASEQYAHGHAAIVLKNGHGEGEDVLFRARSGSYAAVKSGWLYVAAIKGGDLDNPATWDNLWVDTGIRGVVNPAWVSNGDREHGGSLACAAWFDGVTWQVRVFYFKRVLTPSHVINLCQIDYRLATGAVSSETIILTLPSDAITYSSLQLGAVCYHELFLLATEQVEASQATWQQSLYGSTVKRYTESGGGWTLDSYAFPYHTCLEGHAVKDSIDNDAASTETVAQWGKRPCGGLAVNEIDANTVAVTFGAIHWRRRGYYTHNAALRSFIYHRDSGLWEQGAEIDKADFVENQRIKLAMFARGS